MKQKTLLFISVPVFALISLAGCNELQRKQIVTFGNATQLTASNIDKAYGLLNEQYFNTQVQRLINDYERDPSSANPRDIKVFHDVECYQARVDILTALAKYGEALTDIMSDDQLNEFDEATKEFGEELRDFSRSEVKKEYLKGFLKGKDPDYLATAVDAIGQFFIKYNRNKKVREIVHEMDEHVTNICDLLSKDQGNVRSQLQASYRQTIVERNQFLVKNYKELPFEIREKEVRFLADLVVQEKQAMQMLDGVDASLSTLKKAHNELDRAFSKKIDKEELKNIIDLLSSEARRIRSFYKSLED